MSKTLEDYVRVGKTFTKKERREYWLLTDGQKSKFWAQKFKEEENK